VCFKHDEIASAWEGAISLSAWLRIGPIDRFAKVDLRYRVNLHQHRAVQGRCRTGRDVDGARPRLEDDHSRWLEAVVTEICIPDDADAIEAEGFDRRMSYAVCRDEDNDTGENSEFCFHDVRDSMMDGAVSKSLRGFW
jgi:hypothetical protein